MKVLHDKRIKKITVQGYFIRSHPWRSPFGPAKAVQIFSIQICGEGRFKSQALLDEAALAACMAYVDLNPVRAKMATTPETSAYTSVKQRVGQAKTAKQPEHLLPFVGNPKKHMPKGLPFELLDYLSLVEITGRCIREDKRGYIDNTQPALLALYFHDLNCLAIAEGPYMV